MTKITCYKCSEIVQKLFVPFSLSTGHSPVIIRKQKVNFISRLFTFCLQCIYVSFNKRIITQRKGILNLNTVLIHNDYKRYIHTYTHTYIYSCKDKMIDKLPK